MCRHIFNEYIKRDFYDKAKDCRVELIYNTCIFCGKTEKFMIHVKDPPKRKLPHFNY